jgi:hypothetical protein
MRVHIPQARDQELAGAVHNLSLGSDRRIAALAQGDDPAILDGDCLVEAGRRPGRIDDGGVRDRQRRPGGGTGLSRSGGRPQDDESNGQTPRHKMRSSSCHDLALILAVGQRACQERLPKPYESRRR